MSIHPLAVVSPHAELGTNVRIGPFCVVEAGVVLGDGCNLAARVTVNSKPGMWFNVDGELVGNEPARFEILPRALRFIAPTT